MTWNENLYTTCAVQVGVFQSEPLYSPLCLLYKYQQGNVWGQDDRPREIPGQGQLGDGLVAGVHQKDDVHGEWGDPFWNLLTGAWGNVLEPSHGGEHPGHAQHPGGADQQDWEQPGHHQRRDEGGWQGPDWDGEMVRPLCLSLEQVNMKKKSGHNHSFFYAQNC